MTGTHWGSSQTWGNENLEALLKRCSLDPAILQAEISGEWMEWMEWMEWEVASKKNGFYVGFCCGYCWLLVAGCWLLVAGCCSFLDVSTSVVFPNLVGWFFAGCLQIYVHTLQQMFMSDLSEYAWCQSIPDVRCCQTYAPGKMSECQTCEYASDWLTCQTTVRALSRINFVVFSQLVGVELPRGVASIFVVPCKIE